MFMSSTRRGIEVACFHSSGGEERMGGGGGGDFLPPLYTWKREGVAVSVCKMMLLTWCRFIQTIMLELMSH